MVRTPWPTKPRQRCGSALAGGYLLSAPDHRRRNRATNPDLGAAGIIFRKSSERPAPKIAAGAARGLAGGRSVASLVRAAPQLQTVRIGTRRPGGDSRERGRDAHGSAGTAAKNSPRKLLKF